MHTPNRRRNSDGWRGVDFWIFIDFQWILLEMGVLVHPQLGLRFGAALPGAFFPRKQHFWKKKIADFRMIFDQNGPNLLLTWGTTIKTGILTPIEFWWVITLNPWNGHPRVLPWPILFGRVAKKVPSTITIPESDVVVWHIGSHFRGSDEPERYTH